MRVEPFTPDHTDAFVEFWNRAFGAMHNAVPMTADLLRRRLLDRTTAVEAFDPRGLILAVEGAEVRGAIHASRQPEAVCRVLDPSWPGGERGLLLLFGVEPAARGRGIGTQLWHAASDYLAGTRGRAIDGQCLNPFYGNSDGPLTPLFGTPEGIALPWGDAATKRFLAKKGFAAKHRAVQLGLDIGEPPPDAGAEIVPRTDERYDFETAVVRDGGKAIGTLVFYPMFEARPGLYGIFETRVAESHQGRGVGKSLVAAALRRLAERSARRVEVLTIPELSPGARELYEGFGFSTCAEWAVF